jgi:hypothetical protein
MAAICYIFRRKASPRGFRVLSSGISFDVSAAGDYSEQQQFGQDIPLAIAKRGRRLFQPTGSS